MELRKVARPFLHAEWAVPQRQLVQRDGAVQLAEALYQNSSRHAPVDLGSGLRVRVVSTRGSYKKAQ